MQFQNSNVYLITFGTAFTTNKRCTTNVDCKKNVYTNIDKCKWFKLIKDVTRIYVISIFIASEVCCWWCHCWSAGERCRWCVYVKFPHNHSVLIDYINYWETCSLYFCKMATAKEAHTCAQKFRKLRPLDTIEAVHR